MRTLYLCSLVLVSVSFPGKVLGQQPSGGESRAGAMRVFLECAARGCDQNHFRTEITFVNWVRDLRDAQLHVIMTSQGSGAGLRYLLDFIGRGELEGRTDQLTYSHSNTDSDDARTQALTGVLAVGLARFAVLLGQRGPFTVATRVRGSAAPPALPPGLQGEVEDPWDYWVFRVGGDLNMDKEDLNEQDRYSANFSANRTTELWKISISGRGSYSRREGRYSNGSKFEDIRKEGSVDGRLYYSLAERWSVGVDGGVSTSTRNNQDLAGRFGGGVEYSFFPYPEWTRRRMTVQGLLYSRYYDYQELTQFDMMSEVVWEGSLRWGVGFRQPWGTANFNATTEAMLHDPTNLHRISLGGRLSLRVARGLEWNVGGNWSRIRDQIYLPKRRLSDEDILLGRRQLPTNSRWQFSTGFSFTFGSIYNNVVNNRFGFIGGGEGFFEGMGRGGG